MHPFQCILSVGADLRLSPLRFRPFNGCDVTCLDTISGTLESCCVDPSFGPHDLVPSLPFHCLKPLPRMVSGYFPLGGSTPLPASIPYPSLRPPTTLPFAPRSMSPNEASQLSPALIGCLVAIGILALLSVVGAGLAIHVQYCRQSDCSVCNTITCSTSSRRSRTIPGSHSQSLAELPTGPLIVKFL